MLCGTSRSPPRDQDNVNFDNLKEVKKTAKSLHAYIHRNNCYKERESLKSLEDELVSMPSDQRRDLIAELRSRTQEVKPMSEVWRLMPNKRYRPNTWQLGDEIKVLRTRLESAEVDNRSLVRQMTTIRMQHSSSSEKHAKEVANFQETLQVERDRFESADQNRQELEQQVATLKQQLSLSSEKYDKEVADLREQLQLERCSSETEKQDREKLESQKLELANQLETALENHDKELSALKAETQKDSEKVAGSHKKHIRQMQEQKEQLQEQVQILHEEKQKLQANEEELAARMTSLSKEGDQYRLQLMSLRIQRDTDNFQNIGDLLRPEIVIGNFSSLFSNQRIDALEVMAETNEDELQCEKELCLVMQAAEKAAKSRMDELLRGILTTLRVAPSRGKESSQLDAGIEITDDFRYSVCAVLKQTAGSADPAPLLEDLLLLLSDTALLTCSLCSERAEVREFALACARLAWLFQLQEPALRLDEPVLGERFCESRHTLHYASRSGDVTALVWPGLRGRKANELLEKPVVTLE